MLMSGMVIFLFMSGYLSYIRLMWYFFIAVMFLLTMAFPLSTMTFSFLLGFKFISSDTVFLLPPDMVP